MKALLIAAVAALGFLLPQSNVNPKLIQVKTAVEAESFAGYSIIMIDDIQCVTTTNVSGEDIISMEVEKLDGTNVMSNSGCNNYTCTWNLSGLKGDYKVIFHTDFSNTYSDIVTVN